MHLMGQYVRENDELNGSFPDPAVILFCYLSSFPANVMVEVLGHVQSDLGSSILTDIKTHWVILAGPTCLTG